jgi:hypothetical protein
MKLIFKELKNLFKVGVLIWKILFPKHNKPLWLISFPQEYIIPLSVIAWHTSVLQDILFIFFVP